MYFEFDIKVKYIFFQIKWSLKKENLFQPHLFSRDTKLLWINMYLAPGRKQMKPVL